MIKELFFPRTLGGKPLFAEHIVGISIDGLTIQVTRIVQKRSGAVIKAAEEHTINDGDPKTYYQRLSTALKRIASTIDAKTEVRVTFPSDKVITKEISVPFLEREKIRMVVEYEVEPVIPFELENAVIDFVIVSKSEVKQASTILVVAAQLNDVKKFVETFEKSGIVIHALTVDTFALAGLCNFLPSLEKIKNDYALIDVGTETTRINIMNKQTLIASRTITRGSEAQEGEENALSLLFDEIKFTLSSFNVKREEPLSIEKIFFVCPADIQSDLTARCTEHLGIPGQPLPTEELSTQKGIKNKAKLLQPEAWRSYTRALGTAFIHERYDEFTLRQKEVELSPRPLLSRQLATTLALLFLLFGGLGLHGFLEMRDLNNRIARIEKKELRKLKKVFPESVAKRKRTKSVKALAKDAAEHVKEQEEMWMPFSKQRLRPLEILQELFTVFNKKKYDLTIDQISITGEEAESHPIEIQGFFRSETGSDHFKHFANLEEDMRNAKTLILTDEVDPVPAADGVKFRATFKQREE
ncbi:MAG: pilus assembly protein PilM [Candidatus Dependentiae bacterium]|jgi:Tfp pilus assembly PilM family ATPase